MRCARITALSALAMTITMGCTDETPVFPPPAPTLTLVATGACDGANIVALAPEGLIGDDTVDDGVIAQYSARITATGIDAGNASGDLTPGTRVVFEVVEPEDDEARLRAGQGVFESSWNSLDQPAQSGAVEFVGRRANDRFLCFIPGTVQIRATVVDYDPAGGGDVRTLESRTFPVRCMEQLSYDRTCAGITESEMGVQVDMGDGDGGADGDMGDGGVDMDVPLPGELSIAFVPPQDPEDLVLGIRGSGLGRRDNVSLTFRVARLDMPPVSPVRVTFDLPDSRPPNVDIRPREAFTDEQGLARVTLIAGGTPGVVSVVARMTDPQTGAELEDRSAVIVIRGGVPSHASMQLTCDDRVVPAFTTRTDGDTWQFGASDNDGTSCLVQLGDRINGQADAATQVLFLTEAGTITQSATTDDMGGARGTMRVGRPAPYDTDPLAYEATAGWNGTFNPRDGLVRVVAVTRGEEDFEDTNGNKFFDDGVDFVLPSQDLDEPYIDVNDNGRYDNDELAGLIEEFRDTDRNTVWTERNGLWDADTEIWTSTLVLWVGNLYTDPPPPADASDAELALRALRTPVRILCEGQCSRLPNFNPDCPASSYYMGPGGTLNVEARFADRNGNCLDGYEQGNTFIETDGALDTDVDNFDFASRCFVRVTEDDEPILIADPFEPNTRMPLVGDGKIDFPLASRHYYRVFDTAGPDDPDQIRPPIVSTFTVGVNYTEVGGDSVTEALTFTVCR